jgi:hypothetical protein
MAFTPPFFDFQLQFARCLAARFHLSLADALFHYTTISTILGTDGWAAYVASIEDVADATAWTYQCYQAHRSLDPRPDDTTYLGHPLFGCFYYLIRDITTIRVHFVKNDSFNPRPLSRERVTARQNELGRMFAHIHASVPAAQTVLGNSWLYNLVAYRRLYPPAYIAQLPMSDEAEFQFLAFWGQCFDRAWNPKPAITCAILERLARLTDLDELRWCFPYQILQPTCPIAIFYEFYSAVRCA